MELEKTKTALKTFDVKEAVLTDLESSTKLTIGDNKSEKMVRKYRQKAKFLQVQIEKRRLKLNREYKERTDNAAEILTTRIKPVYDDLDGKIKVVEAERENRRLEKEAAEKAERERLEKIESERVDKIETAIGDLTDAALSGQRYNLTAEEIKKYHHALNNLEISKDVFQDRYKDAMEIWKNGLEDTHTALIAREKFEQEQAKQEAEKKRLAEERSKFEAEQKAARKEQEKLRLEREAIEKEKARIEDEKQLNIDWDNAITENNLFDKERLKRLESDWDTAISENEIFDRTVKEKRLADKKRSALVSADKDNIIKFLESLDDAVTDCLSDLPELKISEANEMMLEFISLIKTEINETYKKILEIS